MASFEMPEFDLDPGFSNQFDPFLNNAWNASPSYNRRIGREFVPSNQAYTTNDPFSGTFVSQRPEVSAASLDTTTTTYLLGESHATIAAGAWIDEIPAVGPRLRLPQIIREPASPAKRARRRSSTVEAPPAHKAKRTPDGGLRCPEPCSSHFTGAAADKNWRRHVEDVLYPDRFRCASCAFACARRNGLFQHMLRTHPEKLWSCPTCGKKFMTQELLYSHMETHRR